MSTMWICTVSVAVADARSRRSLEGDPCPRTCRARRGSPDRMPLSAARSGRSNEIDSAFTSIDVAVREVRLQVVRRGLRRLAVEHERLRGRIELERSDRSVAEAAVVELVRVRPSLRRTDQARIERAAVRVSASDGYCGGNTRQKDDAGSNHGLRPRFSPAALSQSGCFVAPMCANVGPTLKSREIRVGMVACATAKYRSRGSRDPHEIPSLVDEHGADLRRDARCVGPSRAWCAHEDRGGARGRSALLARPRDAPASAPRRRARATISWSSSRRPPSGIAGASCSSRSRRASPTSTRDAHPPRLPERRRSPAGHEPRPRERRRRRARRSTSSSSPAARLRAARGEGARREPRQVAAPLPLRARRADQHRARDDDRARRRQAPRRHPREEPLRHRRRRRQHLRRREDAPTASRSGPQRTRGPMLRFKLSQNDSVNFDSREFVDADLERARSPGSAALGKKPINIADVYDIPPGSPYGFDRRFDEKIGYRTKSMLTVAAHLAARRGHRRHPADQQEEGPREEALHEGGRRGAGHPLRRAQRGAPRHGRRAGRRLARERDALRRDPPALRGLREGERRGDRVARSDDERSLAPRRRPHRRARQGRRRASRTGPYKDATLHRARTCASSSTRASSTTSARSACARRCSSRRRSSTTRRSSSIRARFDFVARSLEADVLARKLRALERGAPRSELDALDKELAERRAELDASCDDDHARRTSRPCSRPATSRRSRRSRRRRTSTCAARCSSSSTPTRPSRSA